MESDLTFWYVASRRVQVRAYFALNHLVALRFSSGWVYLHVLRVNIRFSSLTRLELIQIYRWRTYSRILGRSESFHANKFIGWASPTQNGCLSAWLGFLEVDNFALVGGGDGLHLNSFGFNHLFCYQLSHLFQIRGPLEFRRSMTLLFLGLATWCLVLSLCGGRPACTVRLGRGWVLFD